MSQDGVTEVGKYRIVEQIGEGAMGVVYRAIDPVLNRTVAIKVMSDALARDDDLRARFLREAQAAGSLQHPNVITIYDFGDVDGHPYIAMEFVKGEDLELLLRKRVPLSIVQKIDILVDVLSGLGYAHKRGVVHRDIKPANIRIDEDGRARIMDFGIAHLQSSKMTRTGLMVGTPAYMAPEQVTGAAIVPGTDLFSVGAVMYELFSHKKPFEGESLQSVFYKIVSQPPPDLTTVTPSLPASLNAIVMQALQKDPNKRYASAADMANALTEARAELDRVSSQPKSMSLRSSIESGLSTRATTKIRIMRPRPRTSTLIAVGAGVVLVVAGIAVATMYRSRVQAAVAPPLTTSSGPVRGATGTSVPAAPSAASSTPVPASTTPGTASIPPVVPGDQSGKSAAVKTPSDRTPARQGANATNPAPTAQELELFRSLQVSSLEARRRASDAGATADQLKAGDDHNAAASAAAQRGRLTEAATRVNLASAAWSAAERDARAAAAAAAAAAGIAKSRGAEVTRRETVTTPPVVLPTPQPVVVQPPPVRPAAPNPAVEIDAVVHAYARAIESRDVAEVKRAYPGATPAQTTGFEQFFATLRSIRASFVVSSLDVHGDAADARLTGAYDYVTTGGRIDRTPVSFQATFRRDGGVWKLILVR